MTAAADGALAVTEDAHVPDRWSAHPYTEADLPTVLAFFTEPDFYFRTVHPGLAAEAEIVALLDEDTRVLCADGEPVGLYAMAPTDGVSAHYELDFRLRHCAPDTWWTAAYREIEAGLRERTEAVRLTVTAGEFDSRLLGILRGLPLTEEGVLEHVVLHRGSYRGYHHFVQLWGVA
ncbi:hypothetical protein [Streptomyces sp. NPDC002790]|uniref:hypothetical protein n=1 Tax=Streptomyces sp. NPDC002790 TaxID=3154431 RepID=UPI00332C91FF